MPFIDMNINDAQESKTAPAGRYDVVITTCDEVLTKEKQKPQYKMQLEIEGDEGYSPVFHYQGLPSVDDEPKSAQFKALLLKRFLKLFNVPIPSNGLDTEALALELIGKRANVELQLGEPYNGNVSNILVVPKLKDENSPTKSTGTGKPPKRG